MLKHRLIPNIILDNGNVGIGTSTPNTQFEISKSVSAYWISGTGTFSSRPQALTITNTNAGGYDPVILFRQADTGGTVQDAGGIGLVGTGPWTTGSASSQVSDMYFLVRNNSGGVSERVRFTSGGNEIGRAHV